MTPSSHADGRPAAWPLLLAASLVLTLLTLALFLLVPRFEATGPLLSPLPPGGLELVSTDDGTGSRADFTLARSPGSHVRVEALAGARDIARQPAIWHQGRIVLLQVDNQGKPRWNLPHVVARLSGTREQGLWRETFALEPGTAGLLLRLEILQTTGTLAVPLVRVIPLREAAGFRRAALFLAACWSLTALGWTAWALARVRAGARRVGLAWLLAAPVLVLSVLPPTATAPIREGAARNVGVVADVATVVRGEEAGLSANLFALSKLGHVAAWLVVGGVFLLARGQRPVVVALAAAVGLGTIAELLQHFSPNRTPGLSDAMLNAGCATLGVLMVLAALAGWRGVRGRRASAPAGRRPGAQTAGSRPCAAPP